MAPGDAPGDATKSQHPPQSRRSFRVFAAATDPIQAISAFMRGRNNAAVKQGGAAAGDKAAASEAEKKAAEKKAEKPAGGAQSAAAKVQDGKEKAATEGKGSSKTAQAEDKGEGDSKAKVEPKPKPEGIAGQPPPPKREQDAVDEESMDSAVARILTYSDSEGDDDDGEEPLKARPPPELPEARKAGETSGHVLAMPGRAIVEKVSGLTRRAMQGATVKAAAPKDHGFDRARRICRQQAGKARQELTLGFFVKVLLLLVLRKLRPRAAKRLELLCLAIPLPAALAKLQKRDLSWLRPSGRLAAVAKELQGFGAPALVLDTLELAYGLRQRSHGVGLSVDVRAMEGETPACHSGDGEQPQAVELAAQCPAAVGEMRRALRRLGRGVPSERYAFEDDGPELMRYAIAEGFLLAATPAERAVALTAALQRLKATNDWLDTERFMRPRLIRAWGHVVRWHGTDAAGHPVLLIRLLRACEANGAEDNLMLRLLSSQMQYAVTHILSDDGGRPDKLVAVVDGRSAGSDSDHRPRYVRQAKHLASVLSQHYPERLAALWLVDLPTGVSSALQAVTKALPPSTRAKLRCCTASDPRLPITLEKLDAYAAMTAPVRDPEGNTPRLLKRVRISSNHDGDGTPSPGRKWPRTPRTPRSSSMRSRLRTSSSDVALATRLARAQDGDGNVAAGGETPSWQLAAVMVAAGGLSLAIRQVAGTSSWAADSRKQKQQQQQEQQKPKLNIPVLAPKQKQEQNQDQAKRGGQKQEQQKGR